MQHLLQHKNITVFSYGEICHALFENAENMNMDESIVLKTVEMLEEQAGQDAVLQSKPQRAMG